MNVRFGAQGTECEGIFFAEGSIPKAEFLGSVSVQISLQNSNLTVVKKALANKAKALGANAVERFIYGQKAHPWWEQILTFKWDTESWEGAGRAVRVKDEGAKP